MVLLYEACSQADDAGRTIVNDRPISDGNDLYLLVRVANDGENTIVADFYSHTFTAVKFFGIAREGIFLQ